MAPWIHARGFAAILLSLLAAAVAGCGDNNVGKADSAATLAGAAGGPGYFDGTGALVRLSSPSGAAAIGAVLYVADTANHVIRKIDTTTGAVTTLAGSFGVSGSADGTASAARFNSPAGIAAVGTTLYVCDTGNHTVRKIVSTSGAVTTLAGSAGSPGAADNTTGTLARFHSPTGIGTDGATLFVADKGNHTVREVTPAGGTSTYAGLAGSPGSTDGNGADARFSAPEGVAVLGSTLYVADTGNHTIRAVVPLGAVGGVTTLAGSPGVPGSQDDAAGTLARFHFPSSLSAIGTSIFVADTENHTVRQVTVSGGVTTLAGGAGLPGSADNPSGPSARFNGPKGIGTNGTYLFVADTLNHAIRRVTTPGAVTTVAGAPPQAGVADGTGTGARFNAPVGASVVGENVFVADSGSHTIRKVTSAGVVTTLAGTPGIPGSADGTGSAALFTNPRWIAAVGTDLYVADKGNHTIRKVTSAGVVTTLAGSPGVQGFADNVTGSLARFDSPGGIVASGTALYVADTGNHAIRKVDTVSGTVTTLAGTGSAGSSDSPAKFNGPEGIALIGSSLYVADTGNHAIRKVAFPSGTTVTFAGTAGSAGAADGAGTEARFSSPRGIAAVGSVLYVSDSGNHSVRRISTTAAVTTFVGSSTAATTRDGEASLVLLNAPAGIAGVPGTIYFTDVNENVVRKILF